MGPPQTLAQALYWQRPGWCIQAAGSYCRCRNPPFFMKGVLQEMCLFIVAALVSGAPRHSFLCGENFLSVSKTQNFF